MLDVRKAWRLSAQVSTHPSGFSDLQDPVPHPSFSPMETGGHRPPNGLWLRPGLHLQCSAGHLVLITVLRTHASVCPSLPKPTPAPRAAWKPTWISHSTSVQPQRKPSPVRPKALTSSRTGLRLNGPGGANSQGGGPSSGVTAPGASQGSSAVKWEPTGDLSQEERMSAWLVLPLQRCCPKYPAHDSAFPSDWSRVLRGGKWEGTKHESCRLKHSSCGRSQLPAVGAGLLPAETGLSASRCEPAP